MKKISLLGSTGSIGTQTLDVIRRNPDRFCVSALACGYNVERLREQIREFHPGLAVCAREEDAAALSREFPKLTVEYGEDGLVACAQAEADICLSALTGIRGLVPTYRAIQAGRDIALANKETLVTGGELIMEAAARQGVRMLPVDSEHSAIFQCLAGNPDKQVRRILLTASGGPFRGWTREELEKVTPQMALAHPNWNMGKKVTIDSATMMNKGLEMIEAHWLFGVDMDHIQVLVHPQSIVHSAVEYMDSSVIAQMGAPDMRIPIAVALAWPRRLDLGALGEELALDFFTKANSLTFQKPDFSVFRCLSIAAEAGARGGSDPVIMNAANEILVQAFLEGRIGFCRIPEIIEEILNSEPHISSLDLEGILALDRRIRRETEKRISRI